MALTDEVWVCSNKKCKYAWYVKPGDKPSVDICNKCGSEIIKSPLTAEEYAYITLTSENRDFIDSMMELKQKDIIEYEIKISMFRNLVEQQEKAKQEEKNKPKCPTCRSTNIRKIGTGERAASVIGFGLLSKKINKTWKCNNCGHTW